MIINREQIQIDKLIYLNRPLDLYTLLYSTITWNKKEEDYNDVQQQQFATSSLFQTIMSTDLTAAPFLTSEVLFGDGSATTTLTSPFNNTLTSPFNTTSSAMSASPFAISSSLETANADKADLMPLQHTVTPTNPFGTIKSTRSDVVTSTNRITTDTHPTQSMFDSAAASFEPNPFSFSTSAAPLALPPLSMLSTWSLPFGSANTAQSLSSLPTPHDTFHPHFSPHTSTTAPTAAADNNPSVASTSDTFGTDFDYPFTENARPPLDWSALQTLATNPTSSTDALLAAIDQINDEFSRIRLRRQWNITHIQTQSSSMASRHIERHKRTFRQQRQEEEQVQEQKPVKEDKQISLAILSLSEQISTFFAAIIQYHSTNITIIERLFVVMNTCMSDGGHHVQGFLDIMQTALLSLRDENGWLKEEKLVLLIITLIKSYVKNDRTIDRTDSLEQSVNARYKWITRDGHIEALVHIVLTYQHTSFVIIHDIYTLFSLMTAQLNIYLRVADKKSTHYQDTGKYECQRRINFCFHLC